MFRSEQGALLALLFSVSLTAPGQPPVYIQRRWRLRATDRRRYGHLGRAAQVTLLGNDDRAFVSRTTPEHATVASAPAGPITAYAGRLWHDTFGGYQISVPLKHESLAVGRLIVDVPSNELGASLLVLAAQQLAAALIVVMIAFVLTNRGRRFITGPIENLLAAMEVLTSKGDYSQRIEPHGPDESAA
jgi:hypothetical protein